MGASPSKTSYEYSYGDNYGPSSGYARSRNLLSPLSSFTPSRMPSGTGRSPMPPYSQYSASPMPMGYGQGMTPMQRQNSQQMYPLIMQPMHLLSNGTPNPNEPFPQMAFSPRMPGSQPVPPMPEPRIPFAGGGPPMERAGSQMPQPQASFSPVPPPMTQRNPSSMPEPRFAFSPGPVSSMPHPQRPLSPAGPGQSQPQPQRPFSPPGPPMGPPNFSGQSNIMPPMPTPSMPVPYPQSQAPLSPLPPNLGRSASQMNDGRPPGMPEPIIPITDQVRSPFIQQQQPEPVVPIMRSPGPDAAMGDRAMPFVPPSLTHSSSTSSSTTDPLSRNPLPHPPRDAQLPPELVRDTAVATLGPLGPARPLSPLPHPLPDLPRDVYLKKKYRPLLVGTRSEKEMYPEGWFANGTENGLARTLSRLNPFKSPEVGGPEDQIRLAAHRRHATMPEFTDFVRNGPPPMSMPMQMEGSVSGGSSNASSSRRWRQRLNPFSLLSPFSRRKRAAAEANAAGIGQGMMDPMMVAGQENWAPPPGFMPFSTPAMPVGQQPLVPPFVPPGRSPIMPMPPLVAAQGPPSPTPAASAPSPGAPPAIRFNLGIPEYAGLCHTSPDSVLYRDRLYPTAAHLFEAMKFLGGRDDIVEEIRHAEDLTELVEIVSENQHHIRRDWAEVAMRKMEEALYKKFTQHQPLMARLLKTGIAELVYAEASDAFWGEGPAGQGANELGHALMRVRQRLQDETSGEFGSDES